MKFTKCIILDIPYLGLTVSKGTMLLIEPHRLEGYGVCKLSKNNNVRTSLYILSQIIIITLQTGSDYVIIRMRKMRLTELF